MKLTIDEAVKQGLLYKVQVRFNGLTLKDCIMADEENGVVEVYDMEKFGEYREYLDDIPTKFMRGDVWIIFKN